MKAVVSVIGKDKTGIIYHVTKALYEENINVEDISQTVLQDYFTMIMLVSMKDTTNIEKINEKLSVLSNELGVSIRLQHEDIFNAMHKI
ncbi:MAG: ACT domain-containing protein [Clostridia bacterium]|nr:ACT domain-containing protein [Clostridia bacterium]MDY5264886.1 ACT domain-containing protein [Eubacteriales bacterium]MDY5440550.1 ACT domain-containing protein [Eubacteriales bacterium]